MKQNNTARLIRVFVLGLSFIFFAAGMCFLCDPVEAEAAVQSTKKVTVKEGKTTTLSVSNPTSKVSWSTSKKKVVKIIKQTGKNKSKATIKGIKKGSATVTAKMGSKKYKIKVTVKHVHKYAPATCTRPRTCSCGATKGNANGHKYKEATCTSPQICEICGAVGSGALGHVMSIGTCRERSRCMRCYIQGDFGDHVWSNGSYRTCNLCNTRYLTDFYQAFFASVGANYQYLTIRMRDAYGLSTIIGTNRDKLEKAVFCPDGKTKRTVYLWDFEDDNTGDYWGSINYGSSAGTWEVYYDVDVASNGYAAIGPNSTITYQLSYGGEKFLVKAGVNGIIEWRKLADWENL